jgi:hypothetical protein
MESGDGERRVLITKTLSEKCYSRRSAQMYESAFHARLHN